VLGFYLYSSLAVFAAQGLGSTNELGNLEEEDPVVTKQPEPPLPIDDYIGILALIGLFYVFMKFRTYHKTSIQY